MGKVVVNLIAATTTSKRHEVKCLSDTNKYPTGIKIEKKQVEELGVIRDEFHGEWNYTSNQRIRELIKLFW